ncbi:nucleoside-diphosphate kinase, partial [Planctomycetota bacterium]
MIKPDSVIRRLIGRILTRYEEKGLQVIAMKMMKVKKEQAEQLYVEHKGKDFYEGILNFIIDQPVVVVIVKGNRAVEVCRTLIGKTRGFEAAPGTIRGDFTVSSSFNVIHAADSVESAEREISIFFDENEILAYNDPNECFRI